MTTAPRLRRRLIGIEQADLWREALAGLPHGYWHSWEACKALAQGTGLEPYLFACEDSVTSARAACAFAEREWRGERDIFTPAGFGGFVSKGDPASFRSLWTAMVAERGYVCGYFALHPMLADYRLHDGLGTSNTLYVIDLGAYPDLHFDRSVTRALRAWRESGREFVTDRAQLCEFLTTHYAPFMRSVGANPAAIWTPATLRAMCLDPNLLMVGVADAHGICAAHTFATTAFGAEAHVNISLREGREFTTALIGWGIDTLATAGLPWLHLGGGRVHEDALARAKEKFRPVRRPFMVAREIYREELFWSLREMAGVTGHASVGMFPGYHMHGVAPAAAPDAN